MENNSGKSLKSPKKGRQTKKLIDPVVMEAEEAATPDLEPLTTLPGVREEKATSPDALNYVYWQNNGGEWPQIYDDRKLTRPKYHIQELMLSNYFTNSAPAKVLEFGCGVGRHLSYLSKVPGIDVHGYDQSRTMIEGCTLWTTPEWIEKHITLGSPTGRLPYPDKSFDIVYTAEVLVHVRPADLEQILSELVRVARLQVLHIEMSPNTEVVSDDHFGCWNHDVVGIYKLLGYECEILPLGYVDHTPYRVVLEPGRKVYTWPPALLSLYRRLESDLERGFANCRREIGELHARIGEKSGELERTRSGQLELESQIAQRDQKLRQYETEIQDLLLQNKTDRMRLEGEVGDKRVVIEDQRRQILDLQGEMERLAEDIAAKMQSEAAAEEHVRQAEALHMQSMALLQGKIETQEREIDRLTVHYGHEIERLDEELKRVLRAAEEAERRSGSQIQRLEDMQQIREQETHRIEELMERRCFEFGQTTEKARAEIAALEQQLLEMQANRDALGALEGRCAEAEAEAEAARAALTSLEGQLAENQAACEALNAELQTGHECRQELERQLEAIQGLEAELGASRGEILALQDRLDRKTSENGQLAAQYEVRVAAEKRQLQAAASNYVTKIAADQRRIQELTEQARVAGQQAAETKAQHEAQLAAAQRRAQEAEDHYEAQIGADLRRIEETETQYASRLAANQRRIEETEAQYASRLAANQREVQAAEAQCAVLKSELEALQQTHQTMEDWIRQALAGQLYQGQTVEGLMESIGKRPSLAASVSIANNIQELNDELEYIKLSVPYRIGQRFARSLLFSMLRFVKYRFREQVTIEALGSKCEESGGTEVWLLEARCGRFPNGIPLDTQRYDPRLIRRQPNDSVPFGHNMLALGKGKITLALPSTGAQLQFLMHPWSGRIAVTAGSFTQIFDLYSKQSSTLCVHPYERPMKAMAPLSRSLKRIPRQ